MSVVRRAAWLVSIPLVAGLAGCGSEPSPAPAIAAQETRMEWAIALHGGAGAPTRDSLDAEREKAYREALGAALRRGADALAAGSSSLDVVEMVVSLLEDDERFNAGRGAVYTSDERHELDAAIMRGSDLATGAVAGVRTVRNPITLARLVMEKTPHVLLSGDGAESFADTVAVERVDSSYFDTPARLEQLHREKARRAHEAADGDGEHSTVGAVALDRNGDLAAATSTGGMTNKLWGRVGDVPIVGAGTYANNLTCAVSGTGRGEEFIRHGVARSISDRMSLAGEDLETASRHLIHDTLSVGDGGVIAIDTAGRIALEFNSAAMFRGAADARGRFDIAIWREDEP